MIQFELQSPRSTMEEPPESYHNRSRFSLEFETAKQEATVRRSEEGSSDLPLFHVLPISDIQAQFGLESTSLGLSDGQTSIIRQKYGINEISPPRNNPLWAIIGFIIGGFNGFLWFAAALCFLSWRLGALVRENLQYFQDFVPSSTLAT